MTAVVQTLADEVSAGALTIGDSTSVFPAASAIEQKPAVLTIATCSLGKVRIEWATNMFRLRKIIGMKTEQKIILNYPLCDARNLAIHEAMADGSEYLLFWDDDMLPHEGTATVKLLAEMQLHPEIDVIGGVYPPRRDIPEPLVVKEKDQGTWWGWRDGRVHKVFMVGTGFMMLRLASLADIDVPTYDLNGMQVREYFAEDKEMSDDFYFAYICQKHGKSVYAHGGVVCSQIDIEGRLYMIPEVSDA